MAHAATSCVNSFVRVYSVPVQNARAAVRGCSAVPAKFRTASFRARAHTRGMRVMAQQQGFDKDAFQVLGIPGVEISPETQFADGTILKGNFSEATGEITEDDEDCSMELSWDPDAMFGSSDSEDLLAKNMAKREALFQDEEAEKEAEEKKKLRAELEEYRNSRTIPEDNPKMLLEYLISSELNELEFEMARCRPQLTPEFFTNIEKEVEESVQGERQDQVKAMLQATKEFVSFMDANVQALAAPADRLKALLTSDNKREKIAEMAGNGEIDDAFMALFFTNIDMAYKSDNEKAGDYMKMMYDHCKKFHNIS